VHTDSTTKSATGTTAPEAPPIPPLTQAEKAREEQKTGRQTAAIGTAAALIRHIYQRGREGYEVDVVTNFGLFRFPELRQPIFQCFDNEQY
jgi:hypothetical protein